MNYLDYVNRKQKEYPETFDPSNLAKKFRGYFESGARIKVKTSYGEEMTGTVGVTTGWRPVFLLMRTKRSMGSSITLSEKDEIVGIQFGKKYVALAGMN